MKKYILSILLGILTYSASAQDNVTLFFLNDGSFKGFYDEEIDSISFSRLDLDSIWHNDVVVQEVWLADSVVRIPVEDIDSICHKVPEPKYKPGVIRLDERYLPYIISVDGMVITFSSELPNDLRPNIGDILLYEGYNDLFPDGFAGKIASVYGDKVTCEEADITDIYDKFIFFGRYALVDRNKGKQETPAYSLRRIRKKSGDQGGGGVGSTSWGDSDGNDEDYGIDNWRLGDWESSGFGIGTIKLPVKFKFKKIKNVIKPSVALDYSVTPTISVQIAWDGYWRSRMFFWRTDVANDYEIKLAATFTVEDEYEDPLSKLKAINPWEEGKVPDFKEIDLSNYGSDESDGDDSQTVYLIDKEIPIPDIPIAKVGFKLGIFMEPTAEASLSVGLKNKGHFEKTFIFKDDKDHDRETQHYTSKPEGETDFFLDVSGKLSLWTGLAANVSLAVGLGDVLEVKENNKVKLGGYIEGEIKAKIADAIADKSVYSLLKDSKLLTGIKFGFDASFDAKFFGKKASWKFFDWSPKKLLWERTAYIYPEFEVPEYSVKGNILTCTSKVSRATLPNTIGFSVYDETGNVVRKFQDEEYYYSEKDHPLFITETFPNLDFARHRYTIVPTTRPMGKEFFQVELPFEYQTVVLCPDSRHPHLIDLGLPSGTKWMCTNVYADNPKDAGGYYQWGKPAKVHIYSNATYRAPNIQTANYQGSEYDAATANLGQPYVTPTLAQFNELLDNSNADIRYSTWGQSAEGVYLKGRNGNNLYLPFSGLKSGTNVNDEFEETGLFLASDAHDAEGNEMHKAFLIREDGRGDIDAEGYGYSVRPVSSVSSGLTFEPQEIEYEVYVGQKVGQYVTVTNNGSAPVSVTVMQTIAPFQVDDACLGTFTVKPKERLNVLVNFSPTEVKEYTSVLTLSYEAGNACVVSKVPLNGKGIDPNISPLQLSTTTLTLTTGQQGTVDIASGSGSYSIEKIEPTGVVTACISGNTISIEAKTAGTATITIKDDKSGQTATIKVTVKAKDVPAEAIDLGLPSGIKWASYNVGATKPEEYGGYYSWGETEVRDQYYFTTYSLCDGTVSSCHDIGENISGTEYDVAHVKWGGEWCMPTKEDFQELAYNCEYKETSVNGVKGLQFTGPNGQYIFLPYTGYVWNTENDKAGSEGSYWSATQTTSVNKAHEMSFKKGEVLWDCYINRFAGLTVRPVIHSTPDLVDLTLSSTDPITVKVDDKATVEITSGNGNYTAKSDNEDVAIARVENNATVIIEGISAGSATVTVTDTQSGQTASIEVTVTSDDLISYLTCPDDHHPHLIDLGLPSGTKWACCNVDDDHSKQSPTNYGSHYAWGETKGKDYYDWSTYIHCDGSSSTCHDLGSDIAGTQYDVAHVQWGGSWVMPSFDQTLELKDNCTSEWTTLNGVKGRRFTGSNGGVIFLPAAGIRDYERLHVPGMGYYWSSTPNPSHSYNAYNLYFSSEGVYWNSRYYREQGFTVRPVSK